MKNKLSKMTPSELLECISEISEGFKKNTKYYDLDKIDIVKDEDDNELLIIKSNIQNEH